jgi:autotransporter passenger strand-loop-strand repeat protein
MTTYYYPSDTIFGGALTVGPADEIVNFHGSGVSIYLFGTAISSTLLDSIETVESGGLDSGSTIGVELNVMSGGTVIGSMIEGVLNVMSGGTVIGLTVDPANYLYNYTLAGEAIGVTLESGTIETISSGGVAIGTTVSNSTVLISGGGIDSGATLYGSSLETVYSGGEAIGTTVSSGATLALGQGAVASGYTISSGGTLELLNYTLGGYTVSNGVVLADLGTVFDTTVESGGTLFIEN